MFGLRSFGCLRHSFLAVVSQLQTQLQEQLQEHLQEQLLEQLLDCLLYTSPSPRDPIGSRMPSSA